MDKKEMFYEKIKNEYEWYLERMEEDDSEGFISRADKFADIQTVYDYLMREKPIHTEEELDYYTRILSPLEFITKCYADDKDSAINHTLNRILDQNLAELDKISEAVLELTRRCEELADEANPFMFELKYNPSAVTEYQAKVLLQFDNPVKVACEFMPQYTTGFKMTMEAIVDRVMKTDIFTQPYELRMDKILPESVQKHEAISEIMSMIPKYDFVTTMKWLNFIDDAYCISEEGVSEEYNPYAQFADVVCSVKSNYGDEILQKLYNLAKEDKCILTMEFKEAAAYLADGGAIESVPELAKYGYFDSPYEENALSAEEFLKNIDEEQGGMDLC